MRKRIFFSLVAAVALAAIPANAVELTIFATGSMADPLKELGEDFTHQTGHTLKFSLGTTGGVMNKLKAGEKGDVIVISDEAADTLEKEGKFAPGTRKDVASSLFGVVVKKAAPTPDISSADALKKTVQSAKHISYPDPVAAAASGGYVETVLKNMGILDESRKKASLKPMGYLVGESVEKGESEIGLTFLSEMEDPGIDVVGALPKQISPPTSLVGFISAHAKNPEGAKTLLDYLASKEAAAVYKSQRMRPGR